MDATDLITRICQIMDNSCRFLIVWKKKPIWMEKLVYSELESTILTQNTKSAYFCLHLEKMCRCFSYISNLYLNYIYLVNNGEESEMVISNQPMFSLYTRNFKRRVTSFHGRICRFLPFLAQPHPSNVTSNTSLISTQQLEIQIFVSQGNPSTVNEGLKG